MDEKEKVILQAEFNPGIKKYVFWVVAFFMFVTIIGIPILLIWALGFGQYVSGRYYENLHCKLTNKHLDFKKGVLFRVEKTIPLENIQDLTFVDNPLLQVLDLRILKVETAGQSNAKGSDMTLIGIKNAANFKQMVLDQRTELRKSDHTQQVDTDAQILETLKSIDATLKEINKK